MYAAVLGLHSLLRWLILAGLAWGLVRSAAGLRQGHDVSATDRKRVTACVGLTNIQLLLGLCLYLFLSPWLAALRLDPAAVMQDETLRFFGVEHPMTMFVAIVVLHVTLTRFTGAHDSRVAWRRLLVGFLIATLAILASIPWPFLTFGRSLVPFVS